MKIWPVQHQRSDAWDDARRSKPTASRFGSIITPTGKKSKAWNTLACQLCAEMVRLPLPDEGFGGNRHTDRGNDLEDEAREEFIKIMGLTCEQVGFITQDNGVVGCSPDSLILKRSGKGYLAGLEIKCPTPGVHVKYLDAGKLPREYRAQVHGSMAVTGLNAWYFISYCRGYRPLILRVKRDAYTELVETYLEEFLIYYAKKQKQLLPKIRLVEDEGKEAA